MVVHEEPEHGMEVLASMNVLTACEPEGSCMLLPDLG